MRIRDIKLNKKVKVVKCSDKACPVDKKYMGQIGIITKAGNGNTVEQMIQVTFTDGSKDAFWPEELKKIEEVNK